MDGGLNPFVRWNPIHPMVKRWNGRTMNNFISRELYKRYAERQKSPDQLSRSVINLALESYMTEHPAAAAADRIDKAIKAWAITKIRLFLFAGHDSTSSMIVYCYYILSKHPTALARIRAEHDEVFGADIFAVADLLIE